jgi:hypothetical protein
MASPKKETVERKVSNKCTSKSTHQEDKVKADEETKTEQSVGQMSCIMEAYREFIQDVRGQVSSAADELGRRNIWNRRSNISVSSIIH